MISLSESSRPPTLLPCSICNKISFDRSRHPPPLPQCSCRTKGARPKSRSATPNNSRLRMLKKSAGKQGQAPSIARITLRPQHMHAACARSSSSISSHEQPPLPSAGPILQVCATLMERGVGGGGRVEAAAVQRAAAAPAVTCSGTALSVCPVTAVTPARDACQARRVSQCTWQ